MGFIDTLKGWVGGHKQQSEQGVDKGAGFVEDKMGGAHSEQIQSAEENAKEEIDKLPGEN